jgi:hypothetical protein
VNLRDTGGTDTTPYRVQSRTLPAWEVGYVQARVYVAPAPPPVSPPPTVGSIDWYAIAQCESGGRWDLNAYHDGGLQFHPDTWIQAGGGAYAPYAYLASAAEQIAVAEHWVDLVGCVQCRAGWPVCGAWA